MGLVGFPQAQEQTPVNSNDVLLGTKAPDWNSYDAAVARYLSRPTFKGTPLTSGMFTNAAKAAYAKTGTYVPYELALAQAQLESQMGTLGRNPSTNPFNVGEYDAGTVKRFKNADEGTMAYYDLMARRYLNKSTKDDLLKSFVNDKGQRYASNPLYEKKVGDQTKYIQRYVSK